MRGEKARAKCTNKSRLFRSHIVGVRRVDMRAPQIAGSKVSGPERHGRADHALVKRASPGAQVTCACGRNRRSEKALAALFFGAPQICREFGPARHISALARPCRGAGRA